MMPYNANEGLLSPGGADGFGRLLMRQGAVTGTPGDQNGSGGPMPLPGGDDGRGFGGGGPMPLPGGPKAVTGGFDFAGNGGMGGPWQPPPMDRMSPDGNAPGGPWGGNPNSYGPAEGGDGRGFGGGGPMPLPSNGWDMNALAQTNPQSIFGGAPKGNPIPPGPFQHFQPEGGMNQNPWTHNSGPTGFQPHPRGGALGDPTGGPQMGARGMGGGRGRDPMAPPQGGEGNPYTQQPQHQQTFNWGLPNKQQRF